MAIHCIRRNRLDGPVPGIVVLPADMLPGVGPPGALNAISAWGMRKSNDLYTYLEHARSPPPRAEMLNRIKAGCGLFPCTAGCRRNVLRESSGRYKKIPESRR